jgi:hypothetical protein
MSNKLFDILGGKVVIHSDTLGIPCFKSIWETETDKNLANNIISYIVLNNHPDSPYVTSMYAEERKRKLELELFDGNEVIKDEKFKYAEQTYIEFLDTLNLKLLRGFRNRLEIMSRYLEQDPGSDMDMKVVKETLSAAAILDKTIKSIASLEKQVRKDELESSTVRGGNEIGHYEIPKKR